MEYNLGKVSKDMRRQSSSLKLATAVGIFGLLGYIFVVILSVCASVGIPVALIWMLVHFIHNGYKW